MPHHRRGLTTNAVIAVVGSLLALGVLVGLLFRSTDDGKQTKTLTLYCAAGIRRPVQKTIDNYAREYGVQVQANYQGSGTLLSLIKTGQTGDLYLAADKSYVDLARKAGLLMEAIPLARQKPVIAVQKGNPKGISSIESLLADDVTLAIGNPEAASIGKLTKKILEETGQWEAVKAKAKTQPTVNEIANSVVLGAVDAAVVWDANVRQRSEKLEMVEVPAFDKHVEQIYIGVLKSCEDPAAALKFCRYLQAPKKGGDLFEREGYEAVKGDPWAEKPTINLYSGGVNRVAIEQTVKEFQQREGVEVNVEYNGCGILVGNIKTGARPDAYFSCDVSFMTQVSDLFPNSFTVSETDMIIAVPKGNPKGIKSLKDLAQPGLKLGVANEQQSALGALTTNLLGKRKLLEDLKKNFAAQTPTADLLVNQLRGGALDAAIVYRANVSKVMDKVDVVDIQGAMAAQPIAMCRETKYKYLTQRLIDAITSARSRPRFTAANFRWVLKSRQDDQR